MSESPILRRRPPSPLVFSPETVLSSVHPSFQMSGSGSGTVSMPFVRRHVTRRLKAAKAECDKELQRVTNNITTFFEERLREGDQEVDRERGRDRGRDRDDGSQPGDSEPLRDSFSYLPADLGFALQSDNECSSDGGYEAETEYTRHSRQRAYPDDDAHKTAPPLTHSYSSPGLHTASAASQMSPASLRRQSTAPWDRPLSSSLSSSAVASSPASSTVMLPEAPITRKQNNTSNMSASWASGGPPSRRLSRSIHIPARPTPSGQSSRSTSRSRSPLPPVSSHASFADYSSTTINRRSSRILIDDPVDPIMTALYDLIGVATDIVDMTVAQLTAQPKICESLVQRVQNIGKAWDDHPDWHGRSWYVQVLLAVASLSRVVEWWEAEKQFWNFDDNDDEDEPLMFVTKPVDDDLSTDRHDAELENFRLNDDDLSKHRLMRPNSQTKRSREDQSKAPFAQSPTPASREPTQVRSDKVIQEPSESARVLATERLRLQAETAQNQNIVMELSLDGEHFLWVNHAWRVVIGTDPDQLSGTRISSLLSPNDCGVFKEATQRLQGDDSHTVEVRFKLQIVPPIERDPSLGILYQAMEGKGMLMIDRIDGQPSHTMWVVKPIAPPRYGGEQVAIAIGPDDLAPEPASSLQVAFDRGGIEPPSALLPFSQPICTDPILCRICECHIPQWYFEKHSETCAETHRLEAEITECNESIGELRNTIRDLSTALDRSSPNNVAEYRGIPIYRPASTPIVSSPLQLFRVNRMQKFGVKKMQKRLLEQLEDILQVAAEVSVPALKEEEAKEPIERQRLLSPSSERKITQIRTWSKPTVEDAALTQLVQDAERVMRQKIDNVVRMQNTIRYSEKIWLEWQDKVENYLAVVTEADGESDVESGSEDDAAEGEEVGIRVEEGSDHHTRVEEAIDDHSSSTSEYAYAGESSSDPTPMASSSAIRTVSPVPIIPFPSVSSFSTVSSSAPSSVPPSNVRSSEARSMNVPMTTNPVAAYAPRQIQHTRSSTPSSVSSPLALAAPIVASSSQEDAMPPMSLDEPSVMTPSARTTIQAVSTPSTVLTIKTHRSSQNLLDQPKLVVTPPASPHTTAREGPGLTREPSTKRSHRRHSTINPLMSPPLGPLSPRQPSVVPITRTNPTSIKDFDIIKPISKGAFGSVFLAKKKATGDYYAIKVLKKADMIAKNQITNVKAERMILMKQAESPFVAKLFFTFQSKDNLYLVMEYLNGGDCAALIKSLGCLPEEWTKNYIAEVILGLEYLHQRGIVHRDLKPDNLLIDQHGHLKLTDFGLSRIGLLGRQHNQTELGRPYTRYSSRSRPPSMDSSYLSSPLIYAHDPSTGGSYFNQRTTSGSRPGNSPYLPVTDDISESSGSESISGLHARRNRVNDSPLQSFATELTTDLRSHSNSGGGSTPPGEQKFVGTPDYLAPETILGLRGDDAAVDWWALGVITYEFLYGIPPFHAETPEKVFENILSGHIEWHEDWIEFSEEARDFIKGLLTLDPSERLGSNGAEEVRAHPFFAGIDWDKVTTTEAAFIPQVTDPESTDYFDPRGAIPQLFQDDDPIAIATQSSQGSPVISSSIPPPSLPMPIAGHKELAPSSASDDFGSFSFKNLPILKQANDDVIRKLRTDQMAPLAHALSEPTHHRRKSVSTRVKKPPSVVTAIDSKIQSTNPPSPATSTSSIASSPSRTSLPPPTPGNGSHIRKTSEFGAIERFKQNYMEDRRNSMPSRLRTASVSSTGDGSGSETWNSSVGNGSQQECHTPPSSVHSIDLRKGPDLSDRAVTCLLAEDNPITAKIIETLLIRLGCRCVVVHDGSEAISVAMGDIKFDCILMDLHMPVLDGEGAARYIRSTNSKNTNTPIIAVSAYSGTDPSELSNVFSASLPKPVQKADLLATMRQLGFKTSTIQSNNPKVVASHRHHASSSSYAQHPVHAHS